MSRQRDYPGFAQPCLPNLGVPLLSGGYPGMDADQDGVAFVLGQSVIERGAIDLGLWFGTKPVAVVNSMCHPSLVACSAPLSGGDTAPMAGLPASDAIEDDTT